MASDTSASRSNASTGAYVPVTDSTGTPAVQAGRKFAPKQIFATILIVLSVVLGLENTGSVPIRLIGPVENSPLWILVFAPLVLGLIAGFLLGHKGKRSRSK